MADELTYQISEEDKKRAERVQKCYEAGELYKTSRGYYEKWAEFQRFWEGDQWGPVTEKTKNYPRPVTNHYSAIIEMKIAGLTYEPPEIYFEPKKGSLRSQFKVPVMPVNGGMMEEGEEPDQPFEITPSELLSTATVHVLDHNDFEGKLENFARSSALLSDGLMYLYWDNSAFGKGEGSFIGEIAMMEVDIADFYVGDPSEPDLQKQPYLMITERRPIDQVKEEYEQYSDAVAHLQKEPASDRKKTYDHEKTEQRDTDYVNLIHFWEKSATTEEKTVGEETVTLMDYEFNYYVVCQDFVIREKNNCFKYSKKYPFAHFPWYPRRKSFYSKSESAELISNQKELNRLQGISLLGAYNAGLPNIRYKEGFVKKEDLPDGPGGKVIKDETPPGQGWGVEYMQPPTIASYIPMLKDSMTEGMKDTSGVHEAWSGKAPSAHLNASAIMALQEAAGVRIRGIQRRMYSAIRDIGIIALGMMKEYYTEDRAYKVFGKNAVEGIAWFNAEKFREMEFDVKVSMGSASPYSKTVVASTLENMLDRGVIDGDIYRKMLPPEVFPRLSDLNELYDDREKEQQEMMLQQQLAIVDEVVAQTIEQARQSGVEISVEALQAMTEMIQKEAEDREL